MAAGSQPPATACSQVSVAGRGRAGPKCHPANLRFYHHFSEIRDAAEAAGRFRQVKTYIRVLQSLRRYPLALQSSHDASVLEGVGKGLTAIFQEMLQQADDWVEGGAEAAPAEAALPEDRAWVASAKRRYAHALEHVSEHGMPGAPGAGSAWKRRRFAASQQFGRRSRGGAPAAANAAASAARPPDGGAAPAAGGSAAAPAAGVEDASQASARQKSRLSNASRLTLAAKRRLSAAARLNLPPAGSGAWCVLAILGLYGGDAPERALAWSDIKRSIDKMRPELEKCDSLQRCNTAMTRLQRRGLVEEVDSRFRLAGQGLAMADGIVRKLEVPLTALSPLRVGTSASSSQLVRPERQSNKEAFRPTAGAKPSAKVAGRGENDDDDDRPLSSFLAVTEVGKVHANPCPEQDARQASSSKACGSEEPAKPSVPGSPDRSRLPSPEPFTPMRLASRFASSSLGSPAGKPRLDESPVPYCALPSPPTFLSRDYDPTITIGDDEDEGVAGIVEDDVPPSMSTFSFRPEDSFDLADSMVAAAPRKRWRALQASHSSPPCPSAASALAASSRAEARSRPAKPKLGRSASAPDPPVVSSVAAMAAQLGYEPASSSSYRPQRIPERSRLKLILDHREVGAGREHAARGALLADLAKKLGAEAVEGRALPLGDVLWVWQPETPDCWPESIASQEFVAGWVVERKTFGDLSASIMDGRYDEQKIRLLEAPGLDGIIYLIEGPGQLFGASEPSGGDEGRGKGGAAKGGWGKGGFGQRLLNRTLPASTLSTTAAHTQIISGFHVVHTSSTAHTVATLVGLHRAILEQGPARAGANGSGPIPYRVFAERTRKSCHQRVLEAFGRMLRVVPHCGPEATEVLVDEFQTPHGFATALRDHSDTDLLLRLKARQRGNRATVSATALAACRELFVV
mmetsp:Transcript_83129/g.269113  ORF Transcript_83129/g.269113 Transcript_83129/m.269113 type:complete len:915 (-) Transcript_83129:54-2798(-)